MPYRQVRGCPECGARFGVRRVANYSYETCRDCHGMWIGYDTLRGLIEEIAPVRADMLTREDDEAPRSCPDCDRVMAKRFLFRIPVDTCQAHQHGVWFDNDELRQVLERVGVDDPEPAERPSSFRGLLEDFFSKS
jgi:Zn-finger nucleic acid-binding protein